MRKDVPVRAVTPASVDESGRTAVLAHTMLGAASAIHGAIALAMAHEPSAMGSESLLAMAMDRLEFLTVQLRALAAGDPAHVVPLIDPAREQGDSGVGGTNLEVGHFVVSEPSDGVPTRPVAAIANEHSRQRAEQCAEVAIQIARTRRQIHERAAQIDALKLRLDAMRERLAARSHHNIEEATMAGLIRKSLDSPEETRPFTDGKGKLELVNMESGGVGRATFEPGWKWSDHVKPLAGTDSCQAAHMGYFVSGRMKVVMDDGEEMDYGPGDFAVMAPGHDAWIIGDEPCVVIDWQGFADYAKAK